jgi:hypothetical protein
MSITKVALQGDNLIKIDDTGLLDFVPSRVSAEFDLHAQERELARLLGAIEMGAGIYHDGRFSRALPLTGAFLAKAEKVGICYDCLPQDHPIKKAHPPEKVLWYLTVLRNEFYGKGNCPYLKKS